MWGVGWVGGAGSLKTLWLHTFNTRGTYVWGGWGGVFKTWCLHTFIYASMAVAICQRQPCVIFCYGPGMQCTGASSGEAPDRWQKKTHGFALCEPFGGTLFLICCKAQNHALRSILVTLTSYKGVPWQGCFSLRTAPPYQRFATPMLARI